MNLAPFIYFLSLIFFIENKGSAIVVHPYLDFILWHVEALASHFESVSVARLQNMNLESSSHYNQRKVKGEGHLVKVSV